MPATEARATDPTHEIVAVDGLRLHVCRYGSRQLPSLVLVHGGCAHLHWWDTFARSVSDTFHIVAMDLRGHGDSSHAQPPAYTLADHARDLAAIIAQLGIERACFVGHSLGALITAKFAIEAPQRVRCLILVDSNPRLSDASVRYLGRLRRFPHPVYKSYEQAVRRFRLLPSATTATAACLRDIASHSVKQVGEGAWTLKFDRETLGQMEAVDFVPSLRAVAMPLAIVRGEHSSVLSQERMERVLADLPGTRAATVANAHHHVMLDNPVGFEHAVRNLLPH